MIERMVVDASIAIAWVHPGQSTPETDALLAHVEQGCRVLVPALWPLEVANALLVLQRRGRLTGTERAAALDALQGLSFDLDHAMAPLAWARLSELADESGLSVYDATYLELALRHRLPLACKDGPLRQSASRAGVAVLP